MHLVAGAAFTFALIILPMVAMIALLFLLGGAEPSAAVPDAMDGTACSSCRLDESRART
jgi:hypothetical protein